MIIGIDGNEANVEKRVGISEYAFELLMEFSSSKFNPSTKLRRGVQSSKSVVYLKGKPRNDMPETSDSWEYRIVKPSKLWTQVGLSFDLFVHRPRPDVFFTPTHYAPRFSPVPTVISIMDLSYIHYPEMFKSSDLYQLKNWTSYSVKNAKKIFTISRASKNDIINTYHVPEGEVVVTYPGIKSESGIMNQESGVKNIRDKFGISKDYILFVGTLQPRKNIVRLIEAFSRICHSEQSEGSHREKDRDSSPASRRTQNDIKLVVVGKKGWLYEEILSSPQKFGVEDKVKFLEFVSDEELTFLYQNALCFVLPSLYEGFGLPVLEAMKNGCPVITSNVSSLPEAGGNAALYVDPLNVEDIASKMRELIEDGKLRKKLIEKGKEHIQKFSWEKTARETLEVLEEVGGRS